MSDEPDGRDGQYHVRIWLSADEELPVGYGRVRIDSPAGRAEGVVADTAYRAFIKAVRPTLAEVYEVKP